MTDLIVDPTLGVEPCVHCPLSLGLAAPPPVPPARFPASPPASPYLVPAPLDLLPPGTLSPCPLWPLVPLRWFGWHPV